VLTISDSVEIAVPAEAVWRWLCALPAHYAEWHPAHHSCEVLRGTLWEPGTVVLMEEDLHGRRHRLRCQVIGTTPGREIEYRAGPWLKGRFRVEPLNGHSRFRAELDFGSGSVARLLDRPLGWLFRRRIASVRKHQREEGLNLKALLEDRSANAG